MPGLTHQRSPFAEGARKPFLTLKWTLSTRTEHSRGGVVVEVVVMEEEETVVVIQMWEAGTMKSYKGLCSMQPDALGTFSSAHVHSWECFFLLGKLSLFLF